MPHRRRPQSYEWQRPDRERTGEHPRPPDARSWWFRRAMYAMAALVMLGAVLVWVSTGGAIAVVATVLAAATAVAAISLARREPH